MQEVCGAGIHYLQCLSIRLARKLEAILADIRWEAWYTLGQQSITGLTQGYCTLTYEHYWLHRHVFGLTGNWITRVKPMQAQEGHATSTQKASSQPTDSCSEAALLTTEPLCCPGLSVWSNWEKLLGRPAPPVNFIYLQQSETTWKRIVLARLKNYSNDVSDFAICYIYSTIMFLNLMFCLYCLFVNCLLWFWMLFPLLIRCTAYEFSVVLLY